MRSTKRRSSSVRRLQACALLLLLMLTSCASVSPPPPVVVKPPAIPAPPVTETLPPAGAYWLALCELRANVQRGLRVTLTPLAPCLALGLDK